jgi:hypothetical protein
MAPQPVLDDYRWLINREGAAWLRRAAESQGSLVQRLARLRKHLSDARAHLVLQQLELRVRGQQKFSRANRMFFTPVGLEQATDEVVAAYKANRFGSGGPAVDLCCGIGGDLLALAHRGPATGVERDPRVALLAEANGEACGIRAGRIRVHVSDVSRWRLDGAEAWHLDPDRRPRGHRTTRPDLHEPSLPLIRRLIERRGNAAVKLAPAAVIPEDWQRQAEMEWISRGGQCRQLVVWFGCLAQRSGHRCATILEASSPRPARLVAGGPEPAPMVAGRIGRYVFDPDPAVLAGRLLGRLASEHGLSVLGGQTAYLTGDRPLDDPALSCFEVTDILPFDLKRVRQLVRARRIGRLEIKKRGVPHDPAQVRRQLNLRGQGEAVLLIARTGPNVTAILCRRSQPNPG